MTWRPARAPVLLAAALAVGAAGCGLVGGDSANQTTAVDVERAAAAWTDPWAAIEEPLLPTADATGANPVRSAGTRTTTYAGRRTPVDVARVETSAAEDAGWSLLGATCEAREVILALGRGADVADGMLAELTVTGIDAETTEARLTVEVAHHGDGSWPDLPGVAAAETCLETEGAEAPLPDPRGDDYAVGEGEPGPDEPVEWQRDALTDDESALRAALAEDPWFVFLAAGAPPEPSLATGLADRDGGAVDAELDTGAGSPAAALAAATAEMTGWEVTWASCAPDGPAAASARLVTPAGAVTARLEAAAGGTVAVAVRIPVPEAPAFAAVTDPDELTSSACLSGEEPTAATREGVPVAVPGPLAPYLG